MNVSDLKDKVSESSPVYMHDSAALEKAFQFFMDFASSTRNDKVDEAAMNIITLAIELNRADVLELDEKDLVRNEFLVDLVSPIVKKIRMDIFHSVKPPFNNIISAGEWLYAESEKPTPFNLIMVEKNYSEFRKSYKDTKKGNNNWSGGTNVEFENLMITFPGIKEENEGWTESIPVGWNENLKRLYEGIQQIINTVNFPEYAITAHILTGAIPILPKYSIEVCGQSSMISKDTWYTRNQVVISLNAADLSFEDLKKIYREYRRRLNYTRKKSIKEKQLKIYMMVQESGGVPERSKNKFWISICEKWNLTYPKEVYKTWGGIRKAYYGIERKIINEAKPEDFFR